MLSYQSPMNSGNNQYGANGGGYQSQQQTNTFGGGAGGYGQYNQNISGQYGSSAGAFSSPQVMNAHSDNSGVASAPVGRYLPGYLTASSFSGVSCGLPNTEQLSTPQSSDVRVCFLTESTPK